MIALSALRKSLGYGYKPHCQAIGEKTEILGISLETEGYSWPPADLGEFMSSFCVFSIIIRIIIIIFLNLPTEKKHILPHIDIQGASNLK